MTQVQSVRRWFHVMQLRCHICDDKVNVTELISKLATLRSDGKVECVKCTHGGRKLRQLANYLGLTL